MPFLRALPSTMTLAMSLLLMACSGPQSDAPNAPETDDAERDAVEVARAVGANTASESLPGEPAPSADPARGEAQDQADDRTRPAESAASEPTNPWLTASLYGNDNGDAALRKVTIRSVANTLRIRIQNQFDFECTLSLDSAGDPATLTNCVSQAEPSPICNPDMPDSECAIYTGCFRTKDEADPACFATWVAKEPIIKLSCVTLKDEEVCNGEYTLERTDGFASPADFTIARSLR